MKKGAIRSPKLHGSDAGSRYYKYYAGYSFGFVEDVLQQSILNDSDVVLDPWNGSGTTTTAASRFGVESIGYDINPVAVVLGRARLLGPEVAGSIEAIASEICNTSDFDLPASNSDPLRQWFGDKSCGSIRSLERSTRRILVGEHASAATTLPHADLLTSSLAAAFYVLLFRVIRKEVRRYTTSNPTWIKAAEDRKIGLTRSRLIDSYFREAQVFTQMLCAPRQASLTELRERRSTTIQVADSSHLPLSDGSVSTVISSPPYCTRLDYVKATLPELAVLELTAHDVRSLRDRMIGTPTMVKYSVPNGIGSSASEFLRVVAAHSSRASSTYYKKYYEQYFTRMAVSLNEIKRVLRPGGVATLVVQDSYYKDIHLDLAQVLGDMSNDAGWSEWTRIDFVAPRTMASINKATRKYRSSFKTIESVVSLVK